MGRATGKKECRQQPEQPFEGNVMLAVPRQVAERDSDQVTSDVD
jgi:hypothetical protein